MALSQHRGGRGGAARERARRVRRGSRIPDATLEAPSRPPSSDRGRTVSEYEQTSTLSSREGPKFSGAARGAPNAAAGPSARAGRLRPSAGPPLTRPGRVGGRSATMRGAAPGLGPVRRGSRPRRARARPVHAAFDAEPEGLQVAPEGPSSCAPGDAAEPFSGVFGYGCDIAQHVAYGQCMDGAKASGRRGRRRAREAGRRTTSGRRCPACASRDGNGTSETAARSCISTDNTPSQRRGADARCSRSTRKEGRRSCTRPSTTLPRSPLPGDADKVDEVLGARATARLLEMRDASRQGLAPKPIVVERRCSVQQAVRREAPLPRSVRKLTRSQPTSRPSRGRQLPSRRNGGCCASCWWMGSTACSRYRKHYANPATALCHSAATEYK